jgi:flavin-binding protein dodecin
MYRRYLSMEEGSVYKIIDLVGSSTKSWEDAVNTVIAKAATNLRDLRIAEVKKLDAKIENGKIVAYRARVTLSFKYEKE